MTLTCISCDRALYPRTACITSDGYRHRRCPGGKPRVVIEIEDVEWMVECGEGLDGAARRLGTVPETLTRKLRAMGRVDLSDALLARNPHDWNRMRGNDPIPVAYPHASAAKNARRNEKRKAERRERAAA